MAFLSESRSRRYADNPQLPRGDFDGVAVRGEGAAETGEGGAPRLDGGRRSDEG